MINKIGGRKFVLCLVILSFTFFLTILGHLEAVEFIKISTVALGLYSAVNMARKK